MPWRIKWQPTPVFLPGEFHGQRSLVGYSLWCLKESDTIEWLSDNTNHNLGRLFRCSLLCRLSCLLSRMNHKNGLMAPKSPVVICMRWSSTWKLCSPLAPQKQTETHTEFIWKNYSLVILVTRNRWHHHFRMTNTRHHGSCFSFETKIRGKSYLLPPYNPEPEKEEKCPCLVTGQFCFAKSVTWIELMTYFSFSK